MKKKYSITLLSLLLTSMVSIPTHAETPEQTIADNSLKNSAVVSEDSEIFSSGTFGTAPWTLYKNGTLSIGAGAFASGAISTEITDSYMVTKIILTGEVQANPDSSMLFSKFTGLLKIDNLKLLNTSNVKNMRMMFTACSSLLSLDLTSFDTSNVTNMTAMFGYAKSLKSLDLSGFDTSNLTSTDSMFYDAQSLVAIDLSSFNTSNVTDMKAMFKNTVALEKLDLSSFDTSNVATMENMFSNSTNLKELTLGKKTKLASNVILPMINATDKFTGYWENIGSEGTVEKPIGDNIWTSNELIANYDGSKDADTYVWQSTSASRVTLNVKDSSVFKGDNWTANASFESATDRFGKSIDLSAIKVEGLDKVNTKVPGAYEVTYVNGDIRKTVTVTVLDYLIGDVNRDGKLTTADVVALQQYLLTKVLPSNVTQSYINKVGDISNDGNLSTADVVGLQQYLLGR